MPRGHCCFREPCLLVSSVASRPFQVEIPQAGSLERIMNVVTTRAAVTLSRSRTGCPRSHTRAWASRHVDPLGQAVGSESILPFVLFCLAGLEVGDHRRIHTSDPGRAGICVENAGLCAGTGHRHRLGIFSSPDVGNHLSFRTAHAHDQSGQRVVASDPFVAGLGFSWFARGFPCSRFTFENGMPLSRSAFPDPGRHGKTRQVSGAWFCFYGVLGCGRGPLSAWQSGVVGGCEE